MLNFTDSRLPTAQLADFDRAAAGMLSYQEPYTDTDVPKIESLPNEALHRNVDIEVIKADADGQEMFGTDTVLRRTD